MTTVPVTHSSTTQAPTTRAPMTPEDIGKLRQAGDPRVSPDGSVVALFTPYGVIAHFVRKGRV